MTDLKHIPLSHIRENPNALRAVNKTTEPYMNLVDSIRVRGVMNAITVREITNPDPESKIQLYGVIDGLHRFTAAGDAGLQTIPAQVLKLEEAEILEAQIIANVQKVDTRPVEYSQQLRKVIISNPTMTMNELARRLGKSITWLSERLGLLKLKSAIQVLVDEGKITLTNAFSLAKLPEEYQDSFVERAMTQTASEFVSAADTALKQHRDAIRAGRTPKTDEFVPTPRLHKLAEIQGELTNPTVGPALIARTGVSTLSEAFALGLAWAVHMDVSSLEVQKAKHEQRLSEDKERKEQLKKDAQERRAKQAHEDMMRVSG